MRRGKPTELQSADSFPELFESDHEVCFFLAFMALFIDQMKIRQETDERGG